MKNFYIENLKDGKVRYRMSYTDPLTNKTKRVTANYDHDSVRNRRKAQEELQGKVDCILRGLNRSNLSFSDVVRYYNTDIAKSLKMSTVTRNMATMNRILATFPQGTLFNNISATMWKDNLADLSKNNPGTYNEYMTRLKTFLKWCVQNEYLTDGTVILKLDRKHDKSKREKVADKFLEPEQASALIDGMKGMTQWQLLTQFMVLSGMRIGEIAALEWKDIYDGYIHVTKTYDFRNKITTSTKTFTSKRNVSIQDELQECIDKIAEYDKWLTGTQGTPNRLVFPGKHDYMQYFTYNKYVKENAERILHKKVTSHTLRHTHVSLMFAQGMPLDVISRRVGHEDSKITREIYLHLTQKVKDADAELIKNVKLL